MQITSTPTTDNFSSFSKAVIATAGEMQNRVHEQFNQTDKLNARKLVFTDYAVSLSMETKDLGPLKARFTYNTVKAVRNQDDDYSRIYFYVGVYPSINLFRVQASVYQQLQTIIQTPLKKNAFVYLKAPEDIHEPIYSPLNMVAVYTVPFSASGGKATINPEQLEGKLVRFLAYAKTMQSQLKTLLDNSPLNPMPPIPDKPVPNTTGNKPIINTFPPLAKVVRERLASLSELTLSAQKDFPATLSITVFNNTLGGSPACRVTGDPDGTIMLTTEATILNTIPITDFDQNWILTYLSGYKSLAEKIKPDGIAKNYKIGLATQELSANMSWCYAPVAMVNMNLSQNEEEMANAYEEFYLTT